MPWRFSAMVSIRLIPAAAAREKFTPGSTWAMRRMRFL